MRQRRNIRGAFATTVAGLLVFYLLLPLYVQEAEWGTMYYTLRQYSWKYIAGALLAVCLFYRELFGLAGKLVTLCTEMLFAVMTYLGTICFDMVFWKRSKGIHGDAQFMSKWDQWRYYFNARNTGWGIGNKHMPDGNAVGKDLTLGGVIALGGMGTGKTTSIGIPSLLRFVLDGEKNVFICDPSGGAYRHTSQMVADCGYKVYRLSTIKETIDQSLRFNPLMWCESVSDCAILAEKIVSFQEGDTTNSTSHFFMSRAKTLLTGILVATWRQAPEYRNLPNAFRLLLHYSSEREIFSQAIEAQLEGEENLRLQWAGLNSTNGNEKELGSVISTAETALAFAGDPNMAYILSGDEFSLRSLRSEKMVFYNQFQEGNKYYNPINALLLSYCFDACLGGQEAREGGYRGTRFILDELFCLPVLTTLPELVSNGRKYDVGVLAIFQGLDQLFTKYKTSANAILDGIQTQVLFKGLKPEYYEKLQKVLGSKTVTDEDGAKYQKPLVAIEEMEQMGDQEAIIKMPALPAIKTHAPLYYQKNSRYYRWSKRGELPSPKRDILEVAYLPFDAIDAVSIEDTIKPKQMRNELAAGTALGA